MLKSEIKERIIKDAISLQKHGINDLAWTKKNAKTLIQELINDKIGILGGDVYNLHQNHLEALSDNWACEPNTTESEQEFYSRSKSESLKYLEEYPSGSETLFSMTFTERII